jgi:hypothetical protein
MTYQIQISAKSIKVLGVSESARKAEAFAKFDTPIEESDLRFMLGNGLMDAAHRATNCMGWVWRQWLMGVPTRDLSGRIERFVERGLELRTRSMSYHKLALYDLFLLHCAIFGSNHSQVRKVAEQIADASGDKGERPLDDGELYAAAWSGMMKYWILGDDERAAEQSQLIWRAYRERGVSAAPKTLVTPWLKRDWQGFAKQQQKDFEKLWQRARKDCWTVKAESSTEVIVTTEKYQIEHSWCWAHCGMALLAHSAGAQVITDPFWFPAAALQHGAMLQQTKEREDPDQLHMF